MLVYIQQEGDFAMRMSEMKEDMRHREMTIRNLEEQTNQLQAGINDMSKELEMKGKEILRIRSEANQAAKYGMTRFSLTQLMHCILALSCRALQDSRRAAAT